MKIAYQDLGNLSANDVGAINQAIVIPAKDALRQLRTLVTGNLTIRDNAYAAIVTLGYQGNSTQTCTSGVEYTFQNPLKTTPIGFTPIKAVDANGASIGIAGFEFNTSRTDGLLGITPLMHSSTGYIGETIRGFRAVADSITPASTVTANVTSIDLPPGSWDISFVARAANATTGTLFDAAVSTTSATIPAADGDSRLTFAGAWTSLIVSLADYHQEVAATTTYYLVMRTTHAAAPALSGRLSAVRTSLVGNGISGLVTGILWGG